MLLLVSGLLLAACATEPVKKPTDVPAELEVGLSALYSGRRTKAHEAFRDLTRTDPEVLDAWEGAVDSLPDDDGIRAGLGRELDARIVAIQGDPSVLALSTLRARINPDLVARERALYRLLDAGGAMVGWPRAALADVFLARGNPDAAYDAYRTATRETPSHARAWSGLARATLEAGRPSDAVEFYDRYLRLRPNDPDALSDLAYILAQYEQRPRDARPYLERAVTVRPDDPHLLVNLGTVCLLQPEPDVRFAKAAMKKALALNPTDPDVHYNLGILYADHASDARRAIQHFERYLALSGGEERRVSEWIKELKAKGS